MSKLEGLYETVRRQHQQEIMQPSVTDVADYDQEPEIAPLIVEVLSPEKHVIDEALLRCADEVLAYASTLYAESVAGASLAGDPLKQDRRSEIAEWIRESERLDSVAETATTTSAQDSVFSRVDTKQSEATTVPSASIADMHDVEDPDLSDSDDELALDITLQALTVGRDAFDKHDYLEAESMLHEALSFVKDLTSHQRARCNLYDIQYMLAVCAFHTHAPATAEHTLLALTQSMPGVDEQYGKERSRNLCTGGSLLAQVQVKLGKLELAYQACSNVLRSTRKLYGKDHDAYYEALALLARISELTGSASKSRLYVSMIPEPSRVHACQKYAELVPLELPKVSKSEARADIRTDAPSDKDGSRPKRRPAIRVVSEPTQPLEDPALSTPRSVPLRPKSSQYSFANAPAPSSWKHVVPGESAVDPAAESEKNKSAVREETAERDRSEPACGNRSASCANTHENIPEAPKKRPVGRESSKQDGSRTSTPRKSQGTQSFGEDAETLSIFTDKQEHRTETMDGSVPRAASSPTDREDPATNERSESPYSQQEIPKAEKRSKFRQLFGRRKGSGKPDPCSWEETERPSATGNEKTATSEPHITPEPTASEQAASCKESGNKLYKLKDFESAISAYSRAIELDAQVATYYSNRAAAYMATSQYQEALQDCNKVYELEPHNPKNMQRMARVYKALGMPKQHDACLRFMGVSIPTPAPDAPNCEEHVSGDCSCEACLALQQEGCNAS